MKKGMNVMNFIWVIVILILILILATNAQKLTNYWEIIKGMWQ